MAVYFVQAGEGGPIKIGFSVRVDLRLSKIRADNHEPVSLLGVMDGDQEAEVALHARFQRRRGEWFEFEPTADLLDFIAKLNPLDIPGRGGKRRIDPATLFVWRRCRVRDSWFEVPYLWHLANPGTDIDDILLVPGGRPRWAASAAVATPSVG